MFKVKMATLFCIASIFWIGVGWIANEYWQSHSRKAQSIMASAAANDAARSGDLNAALEYAAYAYAYDQESPLADLQIKEFSSKRAKLGCGEILPPAGHPMK